jgi:hypothetical protein
MKARLAAAAAIVVLTSTAQAADVGVSIGISQPGVYGRIDIGRFPQPAVIVPQPVIIAPPRVVVAPPRVVVAPPQPVYMWVPPGHQKNWRKHCHRYSACGVPVYFVREEWYEQHVRYGGDSRRGSGYDDRGHGKGKGRGHGKGRD